MHETGHALVAALSPHADPVAKITILPAGQALGVTEQLPESEWGLSNRVGPVGYSSDSPTYLGEAGLTSRPYAEETQRAIDEEVAGLLRDAEARATELLSVHRAHIDRVVALLLEKETIDGADLLAIVRGGSTLPRLMLVPPAPTT